MSGLRFPGLAAELEAAAVRQSDRRRRWRPFRLRRGSALLASALVLTTGSAGAVLVTRAVVGGPPTTRYGAEAPEADSDMPLHYASRPVLLGGAPLANGRRYELVGYQMRSKFGTDLCLDVTFEPDGTSSGCGNDSEQAQGTSLGGSMKTDGHVTGATGPEVARVVVTYESRGPRRRSLAALTHVSGDVARRAQIDAPFGFYVAEVPYDAQDLKASAFSRDGRRLWTAVFLTGQSNKKTRHDKSRATQRPRG